MKCCVAAVKGFKYFTIVQIILIFFGITEAHSGYFENRLPLKPMLAGRLQPRKNCNSCKFV